MSKSKRFLKTLAVASTIILTFLGVTEPVWGMWDDMQDEEIKRQAIKHLQCHSSKGSDFVLNAHIGPNHDTIKYKTLTQNCEYCKINVEELQIQKNLQKRLSVLEDTVKDTQGTLLALQRVQEQVQRLESELIQHRLLAQEYKQRELEKRKRREDKEQHKREKEKQIGSLPEEKDHKLPLLSLTPTPTHAVSSVGQVENLAEFHRLQQYKQTTDAIMIDNIITQYKILASKSLTYADLGEVCRQIFPLYIVRQKINRERNIEDLSCDAVVEALTSENLQSFRQNYSYRANDGGRQCTHPTHVKENQGLMEVIKKDVLESLRVYEMSYSIIHPRKDEFLKM